MTTESVLRIVESIISMIQSFAWPIVFLIIIGFFRDPLKKFLDNLAEFKIKAGGVEASARRHLEAAASLGVATARRGQTFSDGKQLSNFEDANEIARIVNEAISPSIIQRIADTSILWVDDNPENNIFEARALRSLGFEIVTSTSTDDAYEKLHRGNYDVIISDIARPEDKLAGYTLLGKIRNDKIFTPMFFYTGTANPQYRQDAVKKGAQGLTDDPRELVRMVISAI